MNILVPVKNYNDLKELATIQQSFKTWLKFTYCCWRRRHGAFQVMGTIWNKDYLRAGVDKNPIYLIECRHCGMMVGVEVTLEDYALNTSFVPTIKPMIFEEELQ